MSHTCDLQDSRGVNVVTYFNLVPRALFPGLGEAREKRPGDEVGHICGTTYDTT